MQSATRPYNTNGPPGTAAAASVADRIDPERIAALIRRERSRFEKTHPASRAALADAGRDYFATLATPAPADWPAPFAPVAVQARGAQITDLDGLEIDDFHLDDGRALYGHAPTPVLRAARQQMRIGLTPGLPSMAMLEAGRLMRRIFGPYRWQIAAQAAAARCQALHVARSVTGRGTVLLFAPADPAGAPRGWGVSACPFNDLEAVEAALAGGDVAAIVTEPVLTHPALVLPRADFHAGLRALSYAHGALLIVDETNTLVAGHGGYYWRHDLRADILIAGKAACGGFDAAIWGLAPEIAERFAAKAPHDPDAGASPFAPPCSAQPNTAQLAALGAALTHLVTPENHARMERIAARLARGLERLIADHGAPWHVSRLGARVDLIAAPAPLKSGADALRARDTKLGGALRLALFNRGAWIGADPPRMLLSPMTRQLQIDRLILSVDEILTELFR